MSDTTAVTTPDAPAGPASTAAAPASAGTGAPVVGSPSTGAPSPEASTAPPTATPPPEAPTRVVPNVDEYVLPEGTPAELRAWAKAHDMTQAQLDAAIGQYGTLLEGSREAERAALEVAGQQHLASWGAEADHKLRLARQALRQNDPDGALVKTLNESGYGNHPAVLDFLYNIGKSMQEGGFIKSPVPRNPKVKTAAQAMYGDTHPSKQ